MISLHRWFTDLADLELQRSDLVCRFNFEHALSSYWHEDEFYRLWQRDSYLQRVPTVARRLGANGAQYRTHAHADVTGRAADTRRRFASRAQCACARGAASVDNKFKGRTPRFERCCFPRLGACWSRQLLAWTCLVFLNARRSYASAGLDDSDEA